MSDKRPPFTTSCVSKVLYPSALFSLERDEILPYERFAYNILGLAVEVLHDRGLPEEITINFTQDAGSFAPWRINAGIRCHLNAESFPQSFEFAIPELLPGMAFLYCSSFVQNFIQSPPEHIQEELSSFLEVADTAVKAYKLDGFAASLRAAYDKSGLAITEVSGEAVLAYDLLTKQIAFHEVAHGYAELLTSREQNPVRRRSFELVADLLATQWMYKKVVVNTPDTAAYREWTGSTSYGDSIYTNCMSLQRSYFSLLCLFALAGAQKTGGKLTLDGGVSHPPGMQRHVLQHVHFMTLVRSNYADVLSPEQFATLDADWSHMISMLHSAGILSNSDLQAGFDPRESDTIEAAADVIEDTNISELNSLVPVLRDVRETLSDAASRRPK